MGKQSYRTCEICGIKERHSGSDSLHFSRFPLDINRCREWLRVVGKQELVHLPIEKLHEMRNVCGNHFQRKDYNKKGNRLKRHVIPTLQLSAAPLTDSQLAEFPMKMKRKESVPVVALTSSQNENIQLIQSQSDPVPNMPSTSQETHILGEISQNERTMTLGNQGDVKKGIKRKTEEPSSLSPRKKKLMKELIKTKCSLASFKKSAKLIEKVESPVLKEIVTSALLNQNRKPKGRRWTTQNKISALAILKRSPKAYRYLQHLMPLPSTRTLINVLKKIPIDPGINKAAIKHLNAISSKKNDLDKFCTLAFDEIALKQRLIYDEAADKVEGYQDLGSEEPGSGRSSLLADHAMVFLLQGIKAKFKQPIAFYFVKGTMSSQTLASKVQEVIQAVEETGFKILTTVCDQGPTNMGALKILKNLSPGTHDHDISHQNYFHFNEKKRYIIYDVPHLFKSIRNNFLNCGEITLNGMTARWTHFYKIEEVNREMFLYMSKITPTHVQPKYRAKMRVKYAAQMLSNTVAAVLKLYARAETDPMQAEQIMQTGTVVQELDRLFDCTNGPSCPDDVKKGRRENVSHKTNHLNDWTDFRKKLESLRFHKPSGEVAKNVKCVQGYLTTLRSLRDIWDEVNRLGFKYLNLRQLNQDALENLFGVIRQHSPTNKNPTCSSFIAALKSSIISGLTAPHNRGSNCEKDFQQLLTNFHNVVFEDPQNKEQLSSSDNKENKMVACTEQELFDHDIPILSLPEDDYDYCFFETETDLASLENQSVVYVSGYIASRLQKNNKCTVCHRYIKIDNPEDDQNDVYNYIKLREWWNDRTSLTYPSVNLCRLVESAVKIFETEIIPCLHYLHISKYAITLFMAKIDTNFFVCKEHKIKVINEIYVRLALLFIRRQCQRENLVHSAREESLADINKRAQQTGTAK